MPATFPQTPRLSIELQTEIARERSDAPLSPSDSSAFAVVGRMSLSGAVGISAAGAAIVGVVIVVFLISRRICRSPSPQPQEMDNAPVVLEPTNQLCTFENVICDVWANDAPEAV
jgi:hypothetical protein